jgi:hypothetical protein
MESGGGEGRGSVRTVFREFKEAFDGAARERRLQRAQP